MRNMINEPIENSTNKLDDKIYNPIVFLNTPINVEQQDAIGVIAQKKQVEAAIDEGASMIGIVATFGAGKSSLIDMISHGDKYHDAITVNMWDCLDNDGTNGLDDFNLLTKSFLSQLATKGAASEKNSSFAFSRYINRRLSKNYGLFSFAASKPKIWPKVILALVFFFVCKLFEVVTPNYSILDTGELVSANHYPTWLLYIAPFVSICALAVCIIFALLVIKDAVIVYSMGRDNKTESTEINDLFDIYTDVIEYLCEVEKEECGKSKKNLIIIEDLDRINNKNTVTAFLRELYRFQNLLGKSFKEQIIFIVSVQPESLLTVEKENLEDKSSKEVFTKLFDYTISLMPVHFEDYSSVIINIINNEPQKKKMLITMFEHSGITIKETDFISTLPNSFSWLIRGQNLSIRDLKDRLNKALSLFISLHNKNYRGTGKIRFESCAAISYLQTQHESKFYNMLVFEDKFASLIRESYKLQNAEGNDFLEVKSNFQSKIQEFILKNDEIKDTLFSDNLIDMIYEGIFDDDFRMYFYSYPKESLILNTDEKDVKKLILIPTRNSDYSGLSEKVANIEKKYELSSDNLIVDCIKNIPEKAPYPYVLLIDNILFNYALSINAEKTLMALATASSQLSKSVDSDFINEHPMPISQLLKRIHNYTFPKKINRHNFYAQFSKIFLETIKFWDTNNFVSVRKSVLEILKDDYIEDIKILYLPSVEGSFIPPIVTETESHIIIDIVKFLNLLNLELVTDTNISYITKKIVTGKKLSQTQKDDIIQASIPIFMHAQSSVEKEVLSINLYEFMNQFRYTNSKLFAYFTEAINKNNEYVISNIEVAKYVNGLRRRKFPSTYLEIIDSRKIVHSLSDTILNVLLNGGYFKSLLLNLHSKNRLKELDYSSESVQKGIIENIDSILASKSELIVDLRLAIILQDTSLSVTYEKLFFAPYEIITKKELEVFPKDKFSFALNVFDTTTLTLENYSIFSIFVCEENRTADETYLIMEHFNYSRENAIPNEPYLVNKVFYSLNMENLSFYEMTRAEKDNIISFLSAPLKLGELEPAIRFMEFIHELIPSLESVVQSDLEKYIMLINSVGTPTSATTLWLAQREVTWALVPSITGVLLEQEYFPSYVAGITLCEQKFRIEREKIPLQVYIDLFNSNAPVRFFMLKNREFMNFLIDNKLFVNLSPDNLLLLSDFFQTGNLFEKITSTLSANMREEYLLKMKPFKNIQESNFAVEYIMSGKTQNCFGKKEVRSTFLHKLKGKESKSSFIEFMNQHFPQEPIE